ncbi:MAG: hypothetical protein IJ424_04905 [Oscillospiraceae bacterium]|nr:hypothetical protein [Oscillospiraceae bacterium]
MDIKILPRKLSGTVTAVPSKAEAHRKLICAAITSERIPSKVRNVSFSADVCATLDALKAIGCNFEVIGDSVIFHKFIPAGEITIDCRESKETLMLMLPLVCCFHSISATFTGSNSLIDESLENLIRVLSSKGLKTDYNGKMPFKFEGDFPSGECYAQSYLNISGLMLALPHNNTDSMIVVSQSDASRAFSDMTAEVLREAKILTAFANGIYIIRGGQAYSLIDTDIGGDFSLASNFVVANAISSNIRVTGLDAMSPQPEKAIFEIIRTTQSSNCKAFELDASDIINLVPILAVYACSLEGVSRINGIKTDFYDCRTLITATCDMINSVGGNAKAFTDHIEIEGVKKLHGGVIDPHDDYRIVLASAILSTICHEPVIIKNCECFTRYYPTFFIDFRRLGGIADISLN